ncbi:MAG: hypothetical protein JRE23_15195 [Deltaproteobacteria bacterium]|nr:hypothetical protein [Deltaproteobacteria bacterium]
MIRPIGNYRGHNKALVGPFHRCAARTPQWNRTVFDDYRHIDRSETSFHPGRMGTAHLALVGGHNSCFRLDQEGPIIEQDGRE